MSENKPPVTDTSMKRPLIISAVIHGVIFLLVIFGLPHFKTEPEIVESIPIDMVADIGELTTTNKPPVKAPVPEKPKEEAPKPKEKPLPPKQVTPPPSEELKEPPKEDKKEAVEKDDLAPPKPKEKPKPEKKPTPKKPAPPKPEKPKEDDSQDFDKLLQNLSDEKPAPDSPDTPDSELMTEPTPSPNVSKFSDSLSISEQDALRQQLAGCWNINPGLMNAQDLRVEVKVVVNPDRTVSSVKIVDQGRYNSDTFFRTMADSALRAVQNPRCSPLKLPEDKYNLWHEMTVVFDPKEMF